jgi:hypothetical protein
MSLYWGVEILLHLSRSRYCTEVSGELTSRPLYSQWNSPSAPWVPTQEFTARIYVVVKKNGKDRYILITITGFTSKAREKLYTNQLSLKKISQITTTNSINALAKAMKTLGSVNLIFPMFWVIMGIRLVRDKLYLQWKLGALNSSIITQKLCVSSLLFENLNQLANYFRFSVKEKIMILITIILYLLSN